VNVLHFTVSSNEPFGTRFIWAVAIAAIARVIKGRKSAFSIVILLVYGRSLVGWRRSIAAASPYPAGVWLQTRAPE
jgi:hypothetical protein